MVVELTASSVPVIIVITITGYIACQLLAELSAMMPDRSGGLPTYAYPAYNGQMAALRRACERGKRHYRQ
jgi:hypothetical protein